MASEQTMAKVYGILKGVWPKEVAAWSPVTLEVYSRVLADLGDEHVMAGVVKAVSESTFLPKPAELRKACLDMTTPVGMTAGEAWGYVCQYIRDWPAGEGYSGRYENGRHIDPPALPEMIQRAVDAVGGMTYLRLSENSMSDRARFMDVYQVLADREREHARMLPEVRQAIEAITEAKRIPMLARRQLEAAS